MQVMLEIRLVVPRFKARGRYKLHSTHIRRYGKKTNSRTKRGLFIHAVINAFARGSWDSTTREAVDDGEHLGNEWLSIDVERGFNVGILSHVVVIIGICIQLSVQLLFVSGLLLTFADRTAGNF